MWLEPSEQGGEREDMRAGRADEGRSRRTLWATGGLGPLPQGRWESGRAGGRLVTWPRGRCPHGPSGGCCRENRLRGARAGAGGPGWRVLGWSTREVTGTDQGADWEGVRIQINLKTELMGLSGSGRECERTRRGGVLGGLESDSRVQPEPPAEAGRTREALAGSGNISCKSAVQSDVSVQHLPAQTLTGFVFYLLFIFGLTS